MTPLTNERLEAILARAEDATEGPWRLRHGTTTENVIHVQFGEVLVAPDGWGWDDEEWQKINADGAFITHAREDVPMLVAEVERLRAERDRGWELAARLEERVARVEALTRSERMPWAIVLMDGSTVAEHLQAVLAGAGGE